MSDTRTTSMLERVPKILAVTASSYGLSAAPADSRKPEPRARKPGDDKPMAATTRRELATH